MSQMSDRRWDDPTSGSALADDVSVDRPSAVRLYEAALSYRTLAIGAYRTGGSRPSGLLLQQLAEADKTLAQYEAWLAEQFAIDGGAS